MKDLETGIKVSTVGEDDHPELEGKYVVFHISEYYGDDIIGVVVGCNRSIGITIVKASDKDKYLMCMVGPTAPGECSYDMYNNPEKMLDVVIGMIQDGHIYVKEILSHRKTPTITSYCSGHCAYRQ